MRTLFGLSLWWLEGLGVDVDVRIIALEKEQEEKKESAENWKPGDNA